MANDSKKLKLTLSSNLEVRLQEAQKEHYDKNTRSEMLKDLIALGLASLSSKKTSKGKAL